MGSQGDRVGVEPSISLLQVYQAKVLRDLHKGVPDPELLQELCSVTDYALRSMKVTVQALGRAMSTMVVLEQHLWLNIAEMWDAELPPSPRLVFSATPWKNLRNLKKQMEAIKHILPR
ncbi:hypothetical protein M9458_033236, partial [Cirrhinus mrigala]